MLVDPRDEDELVAMTRAVEDVLEEIDAGALAGRGLELLWAADPVDAFFLHVQGSGRVIFPDGRVQRVGFAGSNGHSFYAIGRALIEEGIVSREESSMQKIRDWLRANPDKAREVMQRNARYIFFRTIDGDGPIGAQGVPLTPGRSLAVDSSLLPLGVPLWLDTTWPATDKPLRRLMVAQDVGSAIKGAVRGDFFWGSGEPALEQAGRMKQTGRYYLLLPKPVAERRETASLDRGLVEKTRIEIADLLCIRAGSSTLALRAREDASHIFSNRRSGGPSMIGGPQVHGRSTRQSR